MFKGTWLKKFQNLWSRPLDKLKKKCKLPLIVSGTNWWKHISCSLQSNKYDKYIIKYVTNMADESQFTFEQQIIISMLVCEHYKLVTLWTQYVVKLGIVLKRIPWYAKWCQHEKENWLKMAIWRMHLVLEDQWNEESCARSEQSIINSTLKSTRKRSPKLGASWTTM